MNTFAVVNFSEEEETAVVPSSWLRNKSCYYPPYKSVSKTEKAIKTVEKPTSQWDLIPATVIDIYDCYSCARIHLKKYEATSDLKKGKRLKITRHISSSSQDLSTELLPIKESPNLPMGPKKFHIDLLESILDIASDERASRSQKISPTKRRCDETSEFEKSVLKELKIINSKQDLLAEEMMLLRGCLSEQTRVSQTGECEKIHTIKIITEFLPLKDMKALKSVEDALLDETTTNKLITNLRRIGGNTADHAIKLLLKRLLDDVLACQFSLLGARGKFSFRSLKLCQVIRDTIRKD